MSEKEEAKPTKKQSTLVCGVKVETFKDRLFSILTHVDNVRDNAKKLIEELIKEEEFELALRLAYNISIHDASKFQHIEWIGLNSSDEKLQKLAVEHHRKTNPHHIEFHEDIKDLSDTEIAELVVDLKSRSEEFGTNVREFFEQLAEKRGISKNTYFYKRAIHFFNLLLDPEFKDI